ncbi:hypothetical protein [Nannocystis exedens]|uniref:hypothetical protein n=1 Tax=Nannocystis exedens TaxID=54 RepID=UPI001475E802|nr:hypothetical protein [Nannocystis exedens]
MTPMLDLSRASTRAGAPSRARIDDMTPTLNRSRPTARRPAPTEHRAPSASADPVHAT